MGKEQLLKKKNKITYCIILLGLLFGCSTDGEDSGPQEVEMESLEITVEQDHVLVNETLQMNVKISPTTTTDRNLLWGSTNKTVATVDESGLVTALAQGKTTITVISEADLRISDVMEIEVQEIP
ncbi:Ig-like domain-containing protein [Flagellimonas amoyensis]|uniref:Ig-like domain-containing protein n=1 Tax=Flagellimonas amoyensis TaxID=2169401 RepID=UPI000D39263E|nr:Ig-like domain-containing protein [Allomuricauda amoyensis]